MSVNVLKKKNESDVKEIQKLKEENARLKKQCAFVTNGQSIVNCLQKENNELAKNLQTTSEVLGKKIRGYKRALNVSFFLNDIQ